jgi:1,4-alpha-glucan branching enzyme
VLVPIDRASLELVWSDGGYPGAAAYADTHRLTARRHRAWSNDGAPYDPARAAAQVRADAEDFASRIAERIAGGGLCVVAMDTELLGDWWPEGVDWLAAALDACESRGVPVVPLDRALAGADPVEAPAALPPTSWGHPRDLTTWSAPAAGGLAWRQRAAELRALGSRDPGDRALRELLALQSSDWAFLVTHGTAGPYPGERFEGHAEAFAAALADPGGLAPELRGLAPWLARWTLA